MGGIKQIAPLISPMNYDIGDKYIKTADGEVRERYNMRPTTLGSILANTGIKGTSSITYGLPAGDNKCVGWCNDSKNEALIFFIYNSNNSHCVFRYFIKTKEIQKIFYAQPELNLSDSILKAAVAENRVYWNDNNDFPKSFNLQMAVNFTNNLPSPLNERYTNADQPWQDNIFPLIKKPPRYAPSVEYETLEYVDGLEIAFNNLRGKLFQFKYNYVYSDNQESAYSPISKVPLPSGELTASGLWNTEFKQNNVLSISINTGGKDIQKINIAARDASDNNAGSFFVFKTLDKFDSNGAMVIADGVQFPVKFLNNAMFDSIDTDYGNAYFHDVPLKANDTLLLDGKYLAMSMPTKNYDKPTMEYRLSVVRESKDFSAGLINMYKKFYFNDKGNCDEAWYTIYLPDEIAYNSTYRIVITKDNEIISAEVAIGATYSGNYPEDVRDDLREGLIDAGFAGYIVPYHDSMISIGFLKIVDVDGNWEGCPYDLTKVEGSVISNSIYDASYKSLKKGQYHPFGVIYNDLFGRYNVVAIDNEHSELYADFDRNDPVAYFSEVVSPQWKLLNVPPEWAYTFRWCYIRDRSYTYMIHVPKVDVDNDSAYSWFDVNKAILAYNTLFPKSILESYVWEKGDRMKIFSGINYSPSSPSTPVEIYDKEIISEKFDSEGLSLGFMVEGVFDPWDDPTFPDLYDQYHIEIYRPNKSPQDTVYLEIGEEHEILNPGTADRVHSGPIANQEFVDGTITGHITALLVDTENEFQKVKILKTSVVNNGISEAEFLASNFGKFRATTLIYTFEAGYSEVIDFNAEYFQITLDEFLPTEFFFSDPVVNYTISLIQIAAEGLMDFGDVYMRNRVYDGTNVEVVEDMGYSDFYVSNAIDVGRVGANIDSEQKTLKRVVRGENYLENTLLNNLNIFLADTESFDVSDAYGDITGIEETGEVLKVIQAHKETSVYIGKNYAKDATGGDIILQTDKTFGSFLRYVPFRGSTYRNSIVSNERYLYYFDESTGEFVRSAPNGDIAISKKYKMQKWFEVKAKELRESSLEKDVIVSVNNDLEEVYISFIIGTNIQTLAFSEKDEYTGFVFFVDFSNGTLIPENFGWYGDQMFSWVNGSMHLHESGAVNSFYGSAKKQAYIRFISNPEYGSDMIFENIEIESEGDWSAEFTIGSNSNYPQGMKSFLSSYIIKKRSGKLNSAILRNVMNRIGNIDLSLLYKGNKMASSTMEVKLTTADITSLNEVTIRATTEK